MTRLHLLAAALLLTLSVAPAPFAVAQTAVAEKPGVEKNANDKNANDKPADGGSPTFDESTPGVGPIRAEDWFVNAWRDRRATFAAQTGEKQHAIAFFGDSITQGWNDDFRGKFASLNVANRGISGDTSRGLLARLDADVLALNPSCVVLLIGTNDIGLYVSPTDVAANVRLILERIIAHDPKTPIILCEVMPAHATMRRPADLIRQLNELYLAIARDHHQVTVLDTYTLFANKEGDAKKEEFPDLLHPNDAGYEKWRAALWPVFATLGLVENDVEKQPEAFKPEPGYELLFNGHNLDGWGYRKTPDAELAQIKKSHPDGKKDPRHPVVETPVDFTGESASADGRFRAINGRLVVTTPHEPRCVQQLNTTRDFSGDFTLKLDFRATPNADSGVFIRGHQLQCRDYPLAGPYKDLKKYKPQDWNELVITVKGNEAHCTCNGEVLEAALKLPDTGPIGVEGDRGQLEYRNIRLHKD